MEYQPGTHIIASLTVNRDSLIRSCASVMEQIEELINQYQLQKLGEVYHDFPGGGFTALICLSESHISLHTWPEHGLINLDIYLSNFLRNNDGTVNGIYETLIRFFSASVVHHQMIRR